ncbi:hypothetical protein A6V39_04970 [Candidatus Mycoplasma haematobovis]|uniref:Uncharacterized protein n=1 Tax=Candidatus Mycoplasma haematobovis TaxID=432608 RepID=A0A1A9QDL0_9MOLU|nr:hypothetical protein [Candidatus Mycoplasma haematobovis]OAL09779.1 hypothetical protein A6V39_04970 [Candidatus Mycoplasma haematobovis]
MTINSSLGAKVVIGLIGGSTLATGSYFIYDNITKERISDLINKNDLTLLTSSDDDTEWAKRWKEYVNDGNDKWKLPSYLTSKSNLDKAPQNFKDHCLNNYSLASKGNEKGIYLDIEKWCTKSTKISKLLEGKVIVLQETGNNETDWTNAWKRYRLDYKTNNLLEIGSWDTASTKENEVPSDYKTKCKAALEKEVKNKKEKLYLAVKSGCAK